MIYYDSRPILDLNPNLEENVSVVWRWILSDKQKGV